MDDNVDFEAISLEFAARNWTWQTTEKVAFVPTKKDIEKAVITMREKLDTDFDDGANCQLNLGRLILQRVDGFYDLYCFCGSL